MTNDTSKLKSTTNSAVTPMFPHAAAPQPPFEPAERQYADRPGGTPSWEPTEGDFS